MDKNIYIERIIEKGMDEYEKYMHIPRNCIMYDMSMSVINSIYSISRNRHLILCESEFNIKGCEIDNIEDCVSYVESLKSGDFYDYYKYNDQQIIICETTYDYYILNITAFAKCSITRLDKIQFEYFNDFIKYSLKRCFSNRYIIRYLANDIRLKS